MHEYKKSVEWVLNNTGIKINGSQPQDIQVNNEKFYQRVLQQGSLGLGESYMEGWWDCEALDDFFSRILNEEAQKRIKGNLSFLVQVLKAKLFNQQTKAKSVRFIAKHYNIGNDLYEAMLDPLMMYSCAYWTNAGNLEQAQENKLKLICEKLKLEPGMKVLDIGCGWGGFASYASKNYQVEVTGLTISSMQAKLAQKRCQNLPVEIKFQDYRDHQGLYDRVLSIGMFEHIGYKNHSTYMRTVDKLLVKEGISLIHTIGNNESYVSNDPWIDRYIFPNSLIPSMAQISKAMEPYFILEDVHNLGLHYDRTLMEWLKRFKNAWPQIKANYSEMFYRMWVYYLSCCAGAFRVRTKNIWQLVLIKRKYPTEYQAIRHL